MRATLFFCVLALLIVCSFAGKIDFHDRELLDDETISFKIGLVSTEDALIGSKNTYFALLQTLSVDKPSVGKVQVLIYYSERESSIGYHSGNLPVQYCCTQTLLNEGHCNQLGEVITNGDKRIQILTADFNSEKTESLIQRKFDNITSNGIYYVKYFNCPGQNLGPVKINGELKFQNPFGFLSADLYPFVWFFTVMTVAYLVLGLIWLVLAAIHWTQILALQNCIAGVIFLGMIECITWFHDFNSYNNSGNFVWGAIVVGVFTSTLKRTVSRLLVLVVSMGFGVVKANLGSDTRKVWTLGVCYFLVSFVQQLILTYLREGENDFFSFLATIIIFPSALLDTLFYWWIFLSLSRTIKQLQLRKQEAKLEMYTRFLYVLVTGGVLTVLVVLYQAILVFTSIEDEMWRTWWMFQAFWHLLYFMILVAIAYLWRPTTNNTRYAYTASEDIELTLQPTKQSKDLDELETGVELHLDLDRFGNAILDDSGENAEELSKMQ